MIRKRGRPRKQKADDGTSASSASSFLVELEFPFELLQFCGGLQQQQREQTIPAQIYSNTVEDISINVNRESNRLKLLLQGLKDFPIRFIENKWCCNVQSVSLPDAGDAAVADLKTDQQKTGNKEDVVPFENGPEAVSVPTEVEACTEGVEMPETDREQKKDNTTTAVEIEAETKPKRGRKRLADRLNDSSQEAEQSQDMVIVSSSPARKSRRISTKPKRFLQDGEPAEDQEKSAPKKNCSEIPDTASVRGAKTGKELPVKEEMPDVKMITSSVKGKDSKKSQKSNSSSEDGSGQPTLKSKRNTIRIKQGTPKSPSQRGRRKEEDDEWEPDKDASTKKQKSQKIKSQDRKEEEIDKEEDLSVNIKSEPVEKSKPVFKCDMCYAKLASEYSLVRHKIKAHNTKMPENFAAAPATKGDQMASEEGAEDSKADVLTKKQELFSCPKCNLCYIEKKTLVKHVKSTHVDEPDYSDVLKKLDEILYASGKRYQQMSQQLISQTCPICGVERVGRAAIKHVELCHEGCDGYQKALEEMQKGYKKKHRESRKIMKKEYERREKDKNLVYMCQYCGKQFLFRPTRSNHENFRCTHNPNRRKLIECYTCGYATPSQEKYDAHILTHKESDRLSCDVCGMQYKTRAGLIVHKRKAHNIFKRHPIVPCTCHICGRNFYDNDHLNKHIATHSDARHFQCELCGSQFKTAAAVQKHQKMYHFNRYRYHCEKCGHGVEKANYLASHKCGRVRRVQSQEVSLDPQKAKKRRIPKNKENQLVHVYEVNALGAENPGIVEMKTEEEVSINLPSQEEYNDATQIVLQLADGNLADPSTPVTVDLNNYVTKDSTQNTGEFHAYSMPVQYENSSAIAPTAGETILEIIPDGSENTLYTTLQNLDTAHGQVIISEEVTEDGTVAVLPEASVLLSKSPGYSPFAAYKGQNVTIVDSVKNDPEGQVAGTYAEGQTITDHSLKPVTVVEMVHGAVTPQGSGMQILTTSIPQAQVNQATPSWDGQSGLAYVTFPQQQDSSAGTTLTSILVNNTQPTDAVAGEEVVVASSSDFEVKETVDIVTETL